MTGIPWPLEPGDTVQWWDGSRYRTGRFMGPISKIRARKMVVHAWIKEPVVTEENGTVIRDRAVSLDALRPVNDGRTVRSRGFRIYYDKEGSWTTTPPTPTRR